MENQVVTAKQCLEADIMYLEAEIRRLKLNLECLKLELYVLMQDEKEVE